MVTCQATNCTLSPSEPLEPNPDIAGVGVIIGFMFSAYFTLVLVIAHYFFDYQNSQNPVDRAFIKFMTPKSWNTQQGRPSKKWTQALEAAIVIYSDMQALTGIAILLSAFLQLQCGISTYHWQVAVDLAWFSSLTHLTTLTSLRGYFRKRPKLAFWRLFFMGANLALLMAAMAPTGYAATPFSSISIPARCLFTEHLDKIGSSSSFNMPLIILTFLFLLTSYITRVIKLFTSSSELARKWLRIIPGDLVKNTIRKRRPSAAIPKLTWYGLQTFLLLLYVLAKAGYEMNESMLWEIIWLIAGMVWGSLKLIGLRLQVKYGVDLNEESVWGFGQILSVSLTILPLWTIYAKVYESNRKMSKKARPVSRGPSQLPCQSFDHFGCFETAWFPKLIMLCFGMALVIAADILLRFPLGEYLGRSLDHTSSLAIPEATRGFAAIYCKLIGICALILTVFVSICLAIQSRSFIQPLKPVRRKATFGRFNSKKESIVQRVLWTLLILSLLGGLIAFDFFVFPFSNDAWFVEINGNGYN